MNESLDTMIEAILFWKGEPMTVPELCRALKASSGEVKTALDILKQKLQGRGLALIHVSDEIALSTAPECHEIIEHLRKEELSRDLGKAALETLSIVLYKGRVSRRDIDYIRGVNSTAILRSLLIRGLIERTQSEVDERMFLYRPTVELCSLLGLRSIEDLPEFREVQKELGATVVEQEVKAVSTEDDGASYEESNI